MSMFTIEDYYRQMIDLQEKLRRSEEERFMLEDKFNEMMRLTRDAEQDRLRSLRHKYHKFIEQDRRRQERNNEILRTLQRIESRASTLAAKTQRFDDLRKQYAVQLKTKVQEPSSRLTPRPNLIREEHNPTYRRKLFTDVPTEESLESKIAKSKINMLEQYIRDNNLGKETKTENFFEQINRTTRLNGLHEQSPERKNYDHFFDRIIGEFNIEEHGPRPSTDSASKYNRTDNAPQETDELDTLLEKGMQRYQEYQLERKNAEKSPTDRGNHLERRLQNGDDKQMIQDDENIQDGDSFFLPFNYRDTKTTVKRQDMFRENYKPASNINKSPGTEVNLNKPPDWKEGIEEHDRAMPATDKPNVVQEMDVESANNEILEESLMTATNFPKNLNLKVVPQENALNKVDTNEIDDNSAVEEQEIAKDNLIEPEIIKVEPVEQTDQVITDAVEITSSQQEVQPKQNYKEHEDPQNIEQVQNETDFSKEEESNVFDKSETPAQAQESDVPADKQESNLSSNDDQIYLEERDIDKSPEQEYQEEIIDQQKYETQQHVQESSEQQNDYPQQQYVADEPHSEEQGYQPQEMNQQDYETQGYEQTEPVYEEQQEIYTEQTEEQPYEQEDAPGNYPEQDYIQENYPDRSEQSYPQQEYTEQDYPEHQYPDTAYPEQQLTEQNYQEPQYTDQNYPQEPQNVDPNYQQQDYVEQPVENDQGQEDYNNYQQEYTNQDPNAEYNANYQQYDPNFVPEQNADDSQYQPQYEEDPNQDYRYQEYPEQQSDQPQYTENVPYDPEYQEQPREYPNEPVQPAEPTLQQTEQEGYHEEESSSHQTDNAGNIDDILDKVGDLPAEKETPNLSKMLDSDTESSMKQDTKVSNDSDFDFSHG